MCTYYHVSHVCGYSQPHFWHKVLTLDTPVLLFLEFFKKINVTNGKGLLYGDIYFLDPLIFKLFGYAFYFWDYFCFHKKLFFCKKFSDWQPAKWSSDCKMFLYVGQNQVCRQEDEETSEFEDNFWQLSSTIFMFQIAVRKS